MAIYNHWIGASGLDSLGTRPSKSWKWRSGEWELGGSVHCTQYLGTFRIDFDCDSDVCLLEKLTTQEASLQTATFHPAIV